MRQLSGLDTAFLSLETARQPNHVGSVVVVDPATSEGFGYQAVYDLIAARLHQLAPFRWRLVEVPLGIDLPYWIDDPDFDLEYHVRHIALPDPGDDRQLAEQVARIHARPLDRRRPLWEVYVIEGLESGYTAIYSKVHHAVVDGVSGAELLTAVVDLEPTPPPPAPDVTVDGEREPGALELLARGGLNLVRQPLRAARLLPRSVPQLGGLVGGFVGRGGGRGRARIQAPRTPFNADISAHRRVAFDSLSLTAVKQIKNAHGVKVNDVVLAICAGGLRRYLLDHDALPDEPLQAMVPISVRKESERGTMGNRVTAMAALLPTDVEDPIERLRRAHETTMVAKQRHAVPADLLQDYTQFAMPAVAALAARTVARSGWPRAVRMPFNVVISNVPGPPVPLYYAGARIRSIYPVSIVAQGVGLNITLQSYLDALDFGLIADRDLVPDLWDLMGHIRDSLDELAAHA